MYFSFAMTKITQGLIFLWKEKLQGEQKQLEKNEWDREIHRDFENAVKVWSMFQHHISVCEKKNSFTDSENCIMHIKVLEYYGLNT
jgi:hypothetical protein